MRYVCFVGGNDLSIFTINSRLPFENLVHLGKNIICSFFLLQLYIYIYIY